MAIGMEMEGGPRSIVRLRAAMCVARRSPCDLCRSRDRRMVMMSGKVGGEARGESGGEGGGDEEGGDGDKARG